MFILVIMYNQCSLLTNIEHIYLFIHQFHFLLKQKQTKIRLQIDQTGATTLSLILVLAVWTGMYNGYIQII